MRFRAIAADSGRRHAAHRLTIAPSGPIGRVTFGSPDHLEFFGCTLTCIVSISQRQKTTGRWYSTLRAFYKLKRTIRDIVRIAPALVTRPKNDELGPVAPPFAAGRNRVPMPVKFGVFVKF